MEITYYSNSKENCLLQDDQAKKMNMDIANESIYCIKSDSSYSTLGQSQLRGLLSKDFLPVLKSAPNEIQLINRNQSGKSEILQGAYCKEMHPKSTKDNKRNTIIKAESKVECLELPNADLEENSSRSTRVKGDEKYFDLNKEQKVDLIIGSGHRDGNGRESDDLIENASVDSKHIICMETRLHKIPKDILGKYGIVIEDSDGCRNSPVSEERISVWNEDDEEGRLIIDEEENPLRIIERENSARCELSENETDFSPVNLSTKENTAGFTNCGHHLVISSVTSLQWSERCNICELELPVGDSLELHKKGHCSFPGCLDYIQDDSEREKHLQIHKAHPIKPFRCEYCKKRFHYYRFTKKHREVCKVLKRLKCPYCHYTSPKVGQFNKHVAKHVNKLTSRTAEKVVKD